jgi:hypothetical protein
MTASGQDLQVMGEVKVAVKIHGYSWRWVFLVSKRLQETAIFGEDFMADTRLVLDLANARIHFNFAAGKFISLWKEKGQFLVFRRSHCSPNFGKFSVGN